MYLNLIYYDGKQIPMYRNQSYIHTELLHFVLYLYNIESIGQILNWYKSVYLHWLWWRCSSLRQLFHDHLLPAT